MTTTSATLEPPADRLDTVRAVLLSTPLDGVRVDEHGFHGKPKACLSNAVALLLADPALLGRARYDLFSGAVLVRPLHLDTPDCWEALADSHLDILADRFGCEYRVHFSHDTLHKALRRVAHLNPTHAVRDYLDGLKWDGEQRARHVFHRYLGAAADPLTEEMAYRWLLSAVARIFEPGCKVDSMVVLVGPGGIGKSQFGAALAGQWFSETPFVIGDKDAYLALQGAWVYEMAELTATRRADVEAVKAFVSGRVDRVRRPYERTVSELPRQCVFLGSTNEQQFLADPTGNRRFWPVACGHAPEDEVWRRIDGLRAVRDQVWAEVVAAYRRGERWVLPPGVAQLLAGRHLQYELESPWADTLDDWLRSSAASLYVQRGLPIGAALEHLGVPTGQRGRHHSLQVGEALTRLGWERRMARVSGGHERRWFPTERWVTSSATPGDCSGADE